MLEQRTSPSCLALNADGTRLYSGNETEKIAEDDAGTISAFAIDRSNGQLKLLNTVSSGRRNPPDESSLGLSSDA